MDNITSHAKEILRSMSLSEKVGQLFLLAFPSKDYSTIFPLLDTYGIGGCYISQDNAETFEEAQILTSELKKRNAQHHNDLPLFFGVDQEGAWGVLIPESTIGPGNLTLGTSESTRDTSDMYRIFAQEMKMAGYNTILGPCADINSDIRNPIIGTRSFGEKTDQVARHVTSAVQAVHAQGMCATAKHFPGHGATHLDTHREIPVVDKSLDLLKASELVPFQAAIDAGVDFMMTAHILFPQLDKEYPATLSHTILTEILRNQMNFKGLIITDSMNMGAMRQSYSPEESTIQAFLAGSDIIMLSEEHYDHSDAYLDKQIASIKSIIDAVQQGRISQEILDDRVFRIIKKKLEIKSHHTISFTHEEIQQNITQHQKVAHTIAKKSLRVLRDSHNLLPISQYNNIAIINTTPKSSYHNLMNKRGIGPNQAISAFQSFIDHFECDAEYTVFRYEDIEGDVSLVSSFDVIIAITEDYPLPGEDFEKREQQILITHLMTHHNDKLVVLGLRSPYELEWYKNLGTYVSTYSSRTCTAVAAAQGIITLQ